MSALPPKADIAERHRDVRFVPKADSCSAAKRTVIRSPGRRERLVGLAQQYKLPAMYEFREFTAAGGLMSYGASLADGYRQVGIYAGEILRGKKQSELPVLQPTRYELVINLKTANTLGLEIPAKLLTLADEVIE